LAGASFPNVLRLAAIATFVVMLGNWRATAEPATDDGQQGHNWPVYQRNVFNGRGHDDRHDRRDFRRGFGNAMMPPVSAGWFQRPYPYHLDFYRMRYGGSYAPYFGNLYGTPQVVNYPPYYGPYYGGYGGRYSNGYGPQGYNGIPMEYPANPDAMMPGAEVEQSSPAATPAGTPAKPAGEPLPAPAP
jgi:hypothetical protein